jgi:phage major head subunit gpT-like protein
LALNTTNFKTAYKELESRVDTQGKKMGLQPNALIVPPSLRFAAAEVLLAINASSGATNVYANEMLKLMGEAPISIHVVQELEADPTIWYLGAFAGDRRPMVWQETEALELIANNDPTSNNMFYDDKMVWLVKGRSQFGWGDPRILVRCEA